ncbi:hypothetical protein GIS00_21280 [Nakamurella sp. YIM 132087]|uniref:Extradiol ring-cleavage dioxygenase class III enzyme subunit B domain-containing protein n=1 Tax=Nakamurella alba TaxID=2665158 RepID=A0A7K1FTH3_9ACTN|nr:hypothetical protein [Nakamurella alba]MTD16473.1 hypothetical protein [Nakamurella alba]
MIVGAVVAPHPPLLLPGVGGGTGGDELRDVRDRAVQAIRDLDRRGIDTWIVVGGVPAAATTTTNDGIPFAGIAPWPGRTGGSLPLSLAVGISLLDAAEVPGTVSLRGIPFDATPQDCQGAGSRIASVEGRCALLVLGDGSARRTKASPGDFDADAEGWDDIVDGALRTADTTALAALDPADADRFLAAGRAAWQVLAGAFAGGPAPTADGTCFTAPLGVAYWVTTWSPGDGPGQPS